MPVRIFRCNCCDFESQDEKEVIEHEKSHVRHILCRKVQKKDVVPCVMRVLETQDAEDTFYNLTFTWNALVTNKETARTLSSVFQVSKDSLQEVFCLNGFDVA